MTDVTRLASMVRKKMGVSNLTPDDFYFDTQDESIWCAKTLYELGKTGTIWYLMQVIDSEAFDWIGKEINLERGKPLWRNSKPLSIIKAVVLPDRVVLVVEGMQTDRIEQKWKKRFSERLSNVPVEFKWKTTYGNYQVLEQGG